MKKKKLKKILPLAAKYAFLILILVFVLIPILYTVAASFKTNAEILAHPENLLPLEPTLDNYRVAWSGKDFNIPRMFFNSVVYSAFCVVFTVLTSAMAGYVFARGGNFTGSKVVFAVFSSLMFINMGTITIYPIFQVLGIFHLSSSLWGLIVMRFFSVGIINIYLVRSYIRTLPTELDEAAEMDGCSFFGTFFRIIAPLLKPILATISILAFNGSWNEYLMPTLFTLSNRQQRPLIVGIMSLKNSGEAAANWNLMLAGATIAMIPIFVVYGVANRYFVEGLTAGAVKG